LDYFSELNSLSNFGGALQNLTQEKLAEKLDIDIGTIGRWLRGETAPSLKNLYLLAQILDVSTDDLVFGGPRDRAEFMSINYEWTTEGRKESRPIISLTRDPRYEIEKMGLKITQLLFRGHSRQEIMQQLNIQDYKTFRRSVRRIVLSDMLRVQTEQVPLNTKLAEKLKKTFGLKTCLVAEVGHINFGWLEMVILGGLGARIITDLAEQSGVRLNVGFAGGLTCGRVIISLMQAETPPKLDVMPIAVQPIKDVVTLDANSLVGILSFFTTGTDLRVYGLPYVSNAQLEQNKHYEPYDVTRQMLEKAKRVDIAFSGLGGDLNSIFHRDPENEMFCQKTLFELKQMGCIGDILYTLVNKDGPIPELQDCCDQMVCSIGLDGLQHLSVGHAHVIAVAGGPEKAPVARLALEKKYFNSLIVDNRLAQAILT
jgi:DNA-binding transcriptional regulator LsrR (DeoR family)/DNA-binding XRE family transcriptional regulator